MTDFLLENTEKIQRVESGSFRFRPLYPSDEQGRHAGPTRSAIRIVRKLSYVNHRRLSNAGRIGPASGENPRLKARDEPRRIEARSSKEDRADHSL
jgi:hypothetical protein